MNICRNELKIPCKQSPLNDSVFEGKKFDVIYHCDVISHLFDPIADFKQMNQRMKDDSYLIFETGNLGEVDRKYFADIDCFQYPDHLFFFNTDNLAKLLQETGFELVKIYRYSISPQLKTKKTLSRLKHSIKKVLSQGKNQVSKPQANLQSQTPTLVSTANSVSTKSAIAKKLKSAYLYAHRYFIYFLRYKVGRIAPKKNRPQTIIVIARKIMAA